MATGLYTSMSTVESTKKLYHNCYYPHSVHKNNKFNSKHYISHYSHYTHELNDTTSVSENFLEIQ